ncbi:4-carboxymuconolactone decarboxylase [Streptomyces sp. LP05-1]|uniref:4-carboxymuconolactone decarboxylase n=1 Tax=Streptomyces pyxinae TaxID=2970734 RepID=A0ABT2CD90_9ACTN|nr:4-carboxymuconolactone decarboxylase [Streptomyces sp. LP05-1]MCS0635348.1 4-carboxymuconolactone decarboxylase [Streptomyces sp. LP05-1]
MPPGPDPLHAPRTLAHRSDGPADAPVLVLGPSLGTTLHMWDRQIPELARQWRVLRFDLPGHGGAPADPAAAVGELTTRLLATLDELGIQRFGYAGCSIGGAIGAELALRAPHRLASLALVAASPRFGTADEFRQRGVMVRANGLEPMARSAPERWFTPGFAAAQPAIVEWAVQMVRTTDPACYVAACEALVAFDVRTELSRVGVPTLVLVGSEDRVTGPAEARTLVAGIPDARLAVVPGASHLAPVEQPTAVTDLLVRHFSTAWVPSVPEPSTGPTPVPPGPGPVGVPPVPPGPGPVGVPPVPPGPGPVGVPPVPPGPGPAHAAVPAGVLPVPPGPGQADVLDAPVPPPAPEAPPVPVAPGPAREVAHPDRYDAGRPDPYEKGLRLRREVLGDAHVDRALAGADDFTGDFDELITRYAWGEIWARDGLDRRTRSCVTLAALVAGGHLEELAPHTRAALRNGLSPAEIREVLMQTAVYCGVPAAQAAFKVARRVILEETSPEA